VTAQDILSLFRSIVQQEGITMLMTSHDGLVDEYVDEVLHLKDGQIENST
jgi:ABC-type lipoprotein export system ATPase subunit